MAKAKATKTKSSSKSTTTATATVTAAAPATAPTVTAVSVFIPVDEHCPLGKTAKVVEDWDAMLNQTNIGHNNNKFYVIQLLQAGGKYHCWTRWGRVGEVGQSALLGDGSLPGAKKAFESKFRDKTSNAWADRKKFVAKAGKYTLIEIERSAAAAKKADEIEEKLRAIDKEAAKLQPKPKGVAPSQLHPSIEKFMHLIFDHNVFRGAMASFDIDVKKRPLGQLTKHQVQKGYEVLE